MANTGENINTIIIQGNDIYTSYINDGINQQGLNENIYESGVKTIPIIIGQSQASYEQNYDVLNYDNNLIQQSNIQENVYENSGYTQNSQIDNYTQNSQIDNYTQTSQIDNYTQNTQFDNYTHYTLNSQFDNYTNIPKIVKLIIILI